MICFRGIEVGFFYFLLFSPRFGHSSVPVQQPSLPYHTTAAVPTGELTDTHDCLLPLRLTGETVCDASHLESTANFGSQAWMGVATCDHLMRQTSSRVSLKNKTKKHFFFLFFFLCMFSQFAHFFRSALVSSHLPKSLPVDGLDSPGVNKCADAG